MVLVEKSKTLSLSTLSLSIRADLHAHIALINYSGHYVTIFRFWARAKEK